MSKSFLFSIVFLILCHIPSFFLVFLINLPRSTSEVSRMLYAIMVPHQSLKFTWHHFTLSLFFPPFSLLLPSPYSFHRFYCFPIFFPFFYVKVLPLFHCFSHLMSYSLIFLLFFSSICPDPPRRAVRGESISKSFLFSIVFLILCHIPSFFLFFSSICPDPPRRADQGGIDTPTSPNCHLVHNPKKSLPGPPFLPPIFLIFDRFGSLCPQTPLTHFVRKNNFA